MEKLVTISLPDETVAQLKVQDDSPYQAVEKIKNKWRLVLEKGESPFGKYKISEVLPIHNQTGIRDQSQIDRMRRSLTKGLNLLDRNELPNVKLVVAPDKKLLLFDGHHSLLTYFSHGKQLLQEVPYLVVSNSGLKPVSSGTISYFFPDEARDLVKKNWENYTVNWHAQDGKLFEKRKVHSLKELSSAFRKRDKGTVKK